MQKLSRFMLVCSALTLTVVCSAQSRSAFFPDTTDNVHLEMVFNYLVDDPNAEAGVVDMVWGSDYTYPANVYNTAYIPYSVDNFTHPVHWYKKNHPDWLEYQCDGKTLAFEFGSTNLAPLDVMNPAVREYQWKKWIDDPLQSGYSGIVVDTLTLINSWKRCGHYDLTGKWIRQYNGTPQDARFRRDVLDWEAATLAHVHEVSPTATMQVNFAYQFGEPVADNLAMMTTTDLLFDERGYTNYGTPGQNVPTPPEWSKITSVLSYVQSKDVCYMTNGEEPELTEQISQQERVWVIANYLLIKNHCTYMYMTGFGAGGGQDYGRLITFPEYSIQIGHPLADRVKKQAVWMREYSGGWTIVNPYNRTTTIRVPAGNWKDVNGARAGSEITLAPQTAAILLMN